MTEHEQEGATPVLNLKAVGKEYFIDFPPFRLELVVEGEAATGILTTIRVFELGKWQKANKDNASKPDKDANMPLVYASLKPDSLYKFMSLLRFAGETAHTVRQDDEDLALIFSSMAAANAEKEEKQTEAEVEAGLPPKPIEPTVATTNSPGAKTK